MLQEAKRNLASYGRRVRLTVGDLEQPGAVTLLERRFHAIVTCAALHHLRNRRHAELYREIHAALEPGGVFVNVDRVRPTHILARLKRRLIRAACAHDATLREHLSRLEDVGLAVRHEAVGTWVLMVGTKK